MENNKSVATFNEQKKLEAEEGRRIKSLTKEYKNEIEKDSFALKISWQLDINKCEIMHKFSSGTSSLEDEFEIIILKLDDILSCGKIENDVFPQDKLYGGGMRSDSKITRLNEFVESGKLVCPPFIKKESAGSPCLIIDGNHRIGLFRYLELSCIPVIVLRTQRDFFYRSLNR